MKNQSSGTLVRLVKISLLAAIYAAVTLAFAPISYGMVQFRISEALTILAVFSPWVTAGLTLGCFISNLIGFSMGQTLLWDVLFGTLASLLAGILTYAFRKVLLCGYPVLSALMPAITNGLIIGTMLTFLTAAVPTFAIWVPMVLSVAAGELLVCLGLGLPLYHVLEKTKLAQKLFDANSFSIPSPSVEIDKNNSQNTL